jgi:hypothetical protein
MEILREKERFLRDVESPEKKGMMRRAWENQKEAYRQAERRARIEEFRAAPRRAILTVLGSAYHEDEGVRSPGETAASGSAIEDVFEAIVEIVRQSPLDYGVELRPGVSIPLALQVIGQLYRIAEQQHPERATRLADALEKRLWEPTSEMTPPSRKPRRRTGLRRHLPTGIFTGLAVVLGPAVWRYYRLQRLVRGQGEAGLEEGWVKAIQRWRIGFDIHGALQHVEKPRRGQLRLAIKRLVEKWIGWRGLDSQEIRAILRRSIPEAIRSLTFEQFAASLKIIDRMIGDTLRLYGIETHGKGPARVVRQQ